jgi:hypothetical protein
MNSAQTVVSVSTTLTYGLYVTETYDQSGNSNHASQATTTKQPQLLPTCIGSLPCMFFSTSAGQYLTAGSLSVSSPWTVSSVAYRNNVSGNLEQIICSNSTGYCAGYASTANLSEVAATTQFTATASDNAWHALQYVSGSSAVINVDGTETTGNSGTNNMSSTLVFGGETVGTRTMHGYVTEAGVWSGFNSTQRGNMCHNQYIYWGTPTSC